MKRRSALKTITLASSSAILPLTLFTTCQSDNYLSKFFTKKELELLDEISETILPETEGSPGAKSQKVANFIDVYVADCYSLENQQLIQKGMKQFEKDCKTKTGKSFLKLDSSEKHNWLVELDQIAKKSRALHYFSLLKSLTLLGYFTSKEGAEKALRYLPIPGKYDGNYPFKEGDKAWALG
jgi:hypothetical protein